MAVPEEEGVVDTDRDRVPEDEELLVSVDELEPDCERELVAVGLCDDVSVNVDVTLLDADDDVV